MMAAHHTPKIPQNFIANSWGDGPSHFKGTAVFSLPQNGISISQSSISNRCRPDCLLNKSRELPETFLSALTAPIISDPLCFSGKECDRNRDNVTEAKVLLIGTFGKVANGKALQSHLICMLSITNETKWSLQRREMNHFPVKYSRKKTTIECSVFQNKSSHLKNLYLLQECR